MPDHLHQLVRGEILRALSIQLPYAMSEIVLASHLERLGIGVPPTILAAHMLYLREKDYIVSEHVEDRSIERWMHRLTPKGTDLIEGNIAADPGIHTPRHS